MYEKGVEKSSFTKYERTLSNVVRGSEKDSKRNEKDFERGRGERKWMMYEYPSEWERMRGRREDELGSKRVHFTIR